MPLGKRMDCGDARYSGIVVPFTQDVDSVLEECQILDAKFDFIVVPLTHPSYRSRPASYAASIASAAELGEPLPEGPSSEVQYKIQ